MSHHKRRRPKHQRSGCLHCKAYKDERVANAAESQPVAVRRRTQESVRDIVSEAAA